MACFCGLFRQRKDSEKKTVEDPGVRNFKIYTYKELRDATQGFSNGNKIGQGGFGSVYKGCLEDGLVVAIKVLSSESNQGHKEFMTEILTISEIVHENLVRLFGCCVEGNQRILVYNYLENNSLAQTLLAGRRNSNIQFSWPTRSKICIGVASGLAFLHEEVKPRVVHRDIKASNILLDKDLTPKISDFGLAKLIPVDITHVSTRVAGTIGYLAPEYAVGGHLTRKADIYSFGVLLLEIVSGRSNRDTELLPEDLSIFEKYLDIMNGTLLIKTWMLYEQNNLLALVDSSLNGDFNVEEACRFLKVGLLCTQDDPKLRPSMSIVVKMLRGTCDVNMEIITKPGIISDFKDLKLRSQRFKETNAMKNITEPSITFTAIIDREST